MTSTVLRLLPIQAQQIAITSAAPDLPEDVPNVDPYRVITMSRSGPSGARVWHARRNVEMVAGLALKYLLGKRLKAAVHLCCPAPPHGLYPLADPADGQGDRNLREIGQLSGS